MPATATTGYKEPTQQMRNKFSRIFGRIKQAVEKTTSEEILVHEPGDITHFRDTDIGARIEWSDGKMTYYLIFDGARIQDA